MKIHGLRRFRPVLFLLVSLAMAAGSEAQIVGPLQPIVPPAQKSPPLITTSLPPGTVAFSGQELCFTVTASTPDGNRVALRLLNPPPGLVFDPVKRAPSPAVSTVRWLPGSPAGRHALIFEARDTTFRARDRGSLISTLVLEIDVLGAGGGAIVTGDVTGDGILDVVARAKDADVSAVTDAGAIHVWAGATVPAGAPTATLTVPGLGAFEHLGEIAGGQGVQLADVTGDGVLDVVAGTQNESTIHVWAGGPGLTGSSSPTATLPGGGVGDQLGNVTGQGILFADLTSDGVLDIVAGTHRADAGAVDTGAIYFWAGGVTLSGVVSPTATLTVSGAVASDFLGSTLGGQAIQLADVTDDGLLDVVAAAPFANVGGVSDAGAIYVWSGASLAGAVTQTATLRVSGAVADDQLADDAAFQLADVTDDGVLDIVAGAPGANVSGVSNTGAVYVWAGGGGLTGTVSPTATLRQVGAVSGDLLGSSSGGVRIADVTDDGALDVVARAFLADVGGVSDAGAVYVFAGGAGLTGTLGPGAALTIPGAVASDQLGLPSILLSDVTDDGALDVVAGTLFANVGGVSDTGAIYVFAGGAGLSGSVSPSATLTVPGAVASDQLGSVLLSDVTDDGALDVVAGAPFANVGGVSDTGAIYVFAGGGGLSGSVSPGATLTVPGAAAGDRLGLASGQGILLADATDDGVLDVVAGAQDASGSRGAIYVFAGGGGLSGSVSPGATLTVPGAAAGDGLGEATGRESSSPT